MCVYLCVLPCSRFRSFAATFVAAFLCFQSMCLCVPLIWSDKRTLLHTLNFPCMYGSSLLNAFSLFLPTLLFTSVSLVFHVFAVPCLLPFPILFSILFAVLISEQRRRRLKLCFAVKRKLYKCSFFSPFLSLYALFLQKKKGDLSFSILSFSFCRQPWLPFKSQRLHGCCCCCNSIADGRRWTGWPPIRWRQQRQRQWEQQYSLRDSRFEMKKTENRCKIEKNRPGGRTDATLHLGPFVSGGGDVGERKSEHVHTAGRHGILQLLAREHSACLFSAIFPRAIITSFGERTSQQQPSICFHFIFILHLSVSCCHSFSPSLLPAALMTSLRFLFGSMCVCCVRFTAVWQGRLINRQRLMMLCCCVVLLLEMTSAH